jgi:hypothetical protein
MEAAPPPFAPATTAMDSRVLLSLQSGLVLGRRAA